MIDVAPMCRDRAGGPIPLSIQFDKLRIELGERVRALEDVGFAPSLGWLLPETYQLQNAARLIPRGFGRPRTARPPNGTPLRFPLRCGP